MRSRVTSPLRLAAAGAVSLVLSTASVLVASAPSAQALDPVTPGKPTHVRIDVAPGEPAVRVRWEPPADLLPTLSYQVLVDGDVAATTSLLDPREVELTRDGAGRDLVVGRTYDVAVRAVGLLGPGAKVAERQTLYIAPVTTVQSANRDNPLAGTDWGVYLGLQDPAMNGWSRLGQADRDALAPIAMTSKAKYFGRWIADGDAEQKTREYVRGSQAGDPDKLTILSLFRMFPWEGSARIDKRLPTKAERAAYKRFVNGMARGIGGARTAVVVQPDGYFVKTAYDAWHGKVGRRKALLPARMLAWTAKTLAALPRTTVYVDMGSEDWARGDVAAVAKFLRLSGVQYARGFALNVSHKNYLDREIRFAEQVSDALAAMGIKDKHAVLDTSDNGHPFSGAEINPPGSHYTPPGEIGPCRSRTQRTPCTALGIPPTTDVDNPAWGLPADVAATAARYVDAYLWVSRPWLPNQGTGGATFSARMGRLLMKTWRFSPYFTGTP